MTRKILLVSTATVMAFYMAGCAATPGAGFVYTAQKAPITATSSGKANKVGVSENCTSFLGIVATGDCSIDNAKMNGGISDVSSVDYDRTNILGIIHTGRTIVKGN